MMTVKTRTFDPAEYLDTEESIQAYIEDAFATRDPAEIIDALGMVAKAIGMTKVAQDAGVSRQALYKALDRASHPEFETIMKVAGALGFKLVPRPMLEPA